MTVSAIRTAEGTTAAPGNKENLFLQPSGLRALKTESGDAFRRGLEMLRERAQDDLACHARALVDYSLAPTSGAHADRVGQRRQPVPLSVRNRRRRAAGLWISAILAGRTDPATLDSLTGIWLPQLAGTGPERALAVAPGARFVEWLRGIFSASIFEQPADNLIPDAYALLALETVLSTHLQAILDLPTRRARV